MFKVRDNLVGQKFGMLTVKEFSHIDERGNALWLCLCDCGNFTKSYGYNLKAGKSKSCGCIKGERRGGDSGERSIYNKLYHSWKGMLRRCYSKKHKAYRWYGEKGIEVCKDWHDYDKFKSWALKNGWEVGLVLDRIDPEKNYEPSNCQWITRSENSIRAQHKPNKKTGYYNVYYLKDKNKYQAVLLVNKVRYASFYYDTAKAAAEAYNIIVKDNKLNRPLNEI